MENLSDTNKASKIFNNKNYATKTVVGVQVSLVLSFIYPQIIKDTRSHFKIRVLQTIKAWDEHLVILIVLVG